MTRKVTGLGLILFLSWVMVSNAQTPAYINGTINKARPVVLGQKSAVMLSLQGRSEAYLVRTADAAKFGLLTAETASGSPDAEKMAAELAEVKGWQVKLGIKPTGDKKEFRVTSLERLSGKAK